MNERARIRGLLAWYLEAGVDEVIAEHPAGSPASAAAGALVPLPAEDGSAPAGAVSSRPSPPPAEPGAGRAAPGQPPEATADVVQTAYRAAQASPTVADLRRVVEAFDGCPLKRSATQLVFTDGNPEARIVFIGEAAGAEEDRQGLPFVGQSGQLLDRMLASIGLDRTRVLISNTVFWRPPGNRTPTTAESAICLPFVERLIELVDPDLLVALGGAAAKSLLGRPESVGRLRGRWLPFSTPRLSRPVQATVTFHPAYLLRTPAQKREAWRDFLEIKRKLAEPR